MASPVKSGKKKRGPSSSRFSTHSYSSGSNLKSGLNDIPTHKWSEILENEAQNNIVFDIREELMTMVANKCYESYLSKQTVRFTAKATYLAWKQLFQWAYIRHDPVEDKYEDNPKWTPDQPPECSVRDTWAGYATPIIKLPKMEDKYVSVCDGDFKDPCENYPPQSLDFYVESETGLGPPMDDVSESDNSGNRRISDEISEDAFEPDMIFEKVEATPKRRVSHLPSDVELATGRSSLSKPYLPSQMLSSDTHSEEFLASRISASESRGQSTTDYYQSKKIELFSNTSLDETMLKPELIEIDRLLREKLKIKNNISEHASMTEKVSLTEQAQASYHTVKTQSLTEQAQASYHTLKTQSTIDVGSHLHDESVQTPKRIAPDQFPRLRVPAKFTISNEEERSTFSECQLTENLKEFGRGSAEASLTPITRITNTTQSSGTKIEMRTKKSLALKRPAQFQKSKKPTKCCEINRKEI